jgi:hypothetical protein
LKRKSDPAQGAQPPATAPGTDSVLAVILSSVIFVFAHFQALSQYWVINDDVRQQIFWMQQWRDPQLFPGDLLSAYARAYVPWGIKGLYRLASTVVDPMVISKWLPGLLFVFLGWCLFRIGCRLGSRRLAWFTLGLYWLMPFFLDNLSGGLSRAFAAPLLAFFCLCWLAANPWGLGLALLLQALFIPYIFLVAAGATVLAWLAGRSGRWPAAPGITWAHLLIVAGGAALVLLMNHQFNAAGFGPLVSAADMARHPEFTAQGRYPILPVPSFFWELVSPWKYIAPFPEEEIKAVVFTGTLFLGAAVWGGRRLDWQKLKPKLQPFGYLLLASLFLYFLARVFLLKLFVPDRYLIYTLNLCYCLGLALCLDAATRARSWPRGLDVAVLVLVIILAVLRLQGVGLKDYSEYRPLYEALAQTPKTARIAGHPNLMDNVVTFGKRPVLATFELAHPWSRGYWERLRPRLQDLFTAYYAEDPQVVRDFCRQYKISFLVVDDRHFTPGFLAGGQFLVPFNQPLEGGWKKLAERVICPFFAPFDAQIQRLTQGRRQFVLLNRDLFPGLVVDKHQRLLDMRPLLHEKTPF